MIIKMLKKLSRRMNEHSEKFSRVIKYKEEPKMKNITTKINTPKGINSKLDETEE